jgi:hypothetical protein
VAATVHHRDNDSGVAGQLIEDTERKPLQKRTVSLAVHNGIRKRIIRDPRKRTLYFV